MSDTVFSQIANDMKEVKHQLQVQADLIQALKDAGEQYLEQEQKMRQLQTRFERWNKMLAARGHII